MISNTYVCYPKFLVEASNWSISFLKGKRLFLVFFLPLFSQPFLVSFSSCCFELADTSSFSHQDAPLLQTNNNTLQRIKACLAFLRTFPSKTKLNPLGYLRLPTSNLHHNQPPSTNQEIQQNWDLPHLEPSRIKPNHVQPRKPSRTHQDSQLVQVLTSNTHKSLRRPPSLWVQQSTT